MHRNSMDSQSSSSPVSFTAQPRVLGHKRRRNGAFAASSVKSEEEIDTCLNSNAESCCTTSGESSSDESDSSCDIEDFAEEETIAAAKRRRRDLDRIKISVRRMEAQVVDASAQLRDLAALVAQVVAQRQQLSQQLEA